jgi:hypothetical protein
MDSLIQELLQRYNEENKVPLSEQELEDLEMEELLSELPGGEHLEPHYERGLDTAVDDPFNYGIVNHRGPLSEAEWEVLDVQAVKEAVASWLGTTLEDIERIYGPGGKTKLDLEIRGQIDERLLQAVEGGASKVAIARALGWGLKKPHNQAPILQKAIRRARKARV